MSRHFTVFIQEEHFNFITFITHYSYFKRVLTLEEMESYGGKDRKLSLIVRPGMKKYHYYILPLQNMTNRRVDQALLSTALIDAKLRLVELFNFLGY